MESASTPKYAIGVTVAAVLVFAAAFMPWGKITARPTINFGGEGLPFGDTPFGGLELSLTVTGWNGNISVVGFELPNWLVVLAAGAVAAISWMSSLSVWKSPVALPVGLGAYGLLHAIFALVMLIASEKGSAGIGVFVTVLAFVGMLVAVVRQHRAARRSEPTPDTALA